MTIRTQVKTQAAAEKAIKAGKPISITTGEFDLAVVGLFGVDIHIASEARVALSITNGSAIISQDKFGNSSVVARGNSSVKAWGNSSVEAWGDSSVVAWESARVVARGNSSVKAWGNSSVEAWESARVEALESARVVAWGNSSVKAWGNSSVEARESARVEAWGNSSVEAWGYVMLQQHSRTDASASNNVMVNLWNGAKCDGGIQQKVSLTTNSDWAELYGVPVSTDGTIILYKGVNEQFQSARGGDYTPGTTPEADIWDGGKVECSHGLHWSPTPRHSHEFVSTPQKYVAAKHRLEDLVIHWDGQFPQKAMTRTTASPVFEVDISGDPV